MESTHKFSMAVKKIVIVGGGISGLSAAFYARKKDPQASISLLEAGPRWGGKIATERVPIEDAHGLAPEEARFIIEGGPDTFLATKPWAVALCKELGLGERLHGTNPANKSTFVLHNDRLLPLPDGLAMMIPTNVQAILQSGLVSWPGKARMGLDFLLPVRSAAGYTDESLGSFVSRRLGREAYENLIEPLMSGIYAGDGDQLSLASTFPYLRDLELKYGSLARGALEMRRKSAASGQAAQGSRSAFLTPTSGLIEIVEKLIESLTTSGVDLRLNTAVKFLDRLLDSKWIVGLASGESLNADAVILAAPAYASAELLKGLDPALAERLRGIPYASTATVTLAYRQTDLPHPLNGYGYVIPRSEGRRALAATFTSTKFPHRAPQGYALIRVFVGRAGQESVVETSQTETLRATSLRALAREELALSLGIQAEPLVSRVFMWEKAMPQYNLGHPERLAQIDAALEQHPGLALAGNAYRGIGIPDCIHSGQLAAEKVA